MIRNLLAALLLFVMVGGARAEDRILWYSIGDGLTNTTNIQAAIDFAVANNFNGFCFLARYRADASYIPRRDFNTYANPEPRMSSSVDGLQYAIDHGREAGLKIYVAFSCFAVAEGSESYPSFMPSGSITYKYVGTGSQTTAYQPNSGYPRPMVISDDSALWADPGRNDVRTYTRNVLKDLIQNYDIDGVFFDRIRYPQDSYDHSDGAFGYNPVALSEMGLTNPPPAAPNFITARQNAITTFLKDARSDIQSMKPWVLVSATPVMYSNSTNSTYNYNFQHFPSWDSAPNPLHVSGYGVLDFIAPQIYKSNSDDVPINLNLVNNAVNETARMFVSPTFSASIATPGDVLARSIQHERSYGNKGFSLFSFKAASVAGYMTQVRSYGTDVLGSSSPTTDYTGFKVGWDQVKPNNITNLAANNSQPGRVTLTWSTPTAATDGDVPVKYLVYRSNTQPVKLYYANLVNKTTTVSGNSFVDTPQTGLANGTWYYRVVPVDEYNNKANSNQTPAVSVSLPADYIIESRSGGKNYANYSDNGSSHFSDSTAKSTAAGLTAGIGSRYAPLTTKDDIAKFTPAGLTAGDHYYDVYVTIPSATTYNAPHSSWRIRLADGTLASGFWDATSAAAGNKWLKIGAGNFLLNPSNCYVEIDNTTTTNDVTTHRFYADAVKFVYLAPAASGVADWSTY